MLCCRGRRPLRWNAFPRSKLPPDISGIWRAVRVACRLWRDLLASAKQAGAETLPLSPTELRHVRRVLAALERALSQASQRKPHALELVAQREASR